MDEIYIDNLKVGMFLISKGHTLFPEGWGCVVVNVSHKWFEVRDYEHNNLHFFADCQLKKFKFIEECHYLTQEEIDNFGRAFTFVNWHLARKLKDEPLDKEIKNAIRDAFIK